MKIQMMIYPLKYMASNMIMYATANCAICSKERTVCSTSDGRYGASTASCLSMRWTPTSRMALPDAAAAETEACFLDGPSPGVPDTGVMMSSSALENVASGSGFAQQLADGLVVFSSLRRGTLEMDCAVGESDM